MEGDMMKIILNNQVDIPVVGFGTFRSKGKDAYEATSHALKAGYRHIDTAAVYDNEKDVGAAIRESGIPREELFITSKLHNRDQGYLSTKRAFKRSLSELGLDYLDLYLIHWPKSYEASADSYQALEELYEEGFIRAIGVSNFTFHHLEHLFETAVVTPHVNQIECHIFLQQTKLHEFCMKHGIHIEAYAPLMSHHVKELLENETMAGLAKKHGKTVAQVALRYLIERDIIVLPKSITPDRISENIALFDFSLDDEDMRTIRGLNRGRKLFPEADNFDY